MASAERGGAELGGAELGGIEIEPDDHSLSAREPVTSDVTDDGLALSREDESLSRDIPATEPEFAQRSGAGQNSSVSSEPSSELIAPQIPEESSSQPDAVAETPATPTLPLPDLQQWLAPSRDTKAQNVSRKTAGGSQNSSEILESDLGAPSLTPPDMGETQTPPAGGPLDLTPEIDTTSAAVPAPSVSQSGKSRGDQQGTSKPRSRGTVDPSLRTSNLSLARTDTRLSIGHLLICESVSGYEQYAEIPQQTVTAGDPVLLYATLNGAAASLSGSDYRTETISQLELLHPTGKVLREIRLGRAIDHSPELRKEYFLTHQVQIPADLPAGDYRLRLKVGDVSTREIATSECRIRVHGTPHR